MKDLEFPVTILELVVELALDGSPSITSLVVVVAAAEEEEGGGDEEEEVSLFALL